MMSYHSKGLLCLGILLSLLCVTTVHLFAKKSKLQPGNTAPAFTLQGDDGKTYRLSDFNNQRVVVYFYPLDDSHYCTQQACSLARGYSLLEEHGIKLFGINHESMESHAVFKKKYNLPFTLLSDPSCRVIKAYNAYSWFFNKRITYLIDKGMIVAVLHDVDVNNHANEIIRAFGIRV